MTPIERAELIDNLLVASTNLIVQYTQLMVSTYAEIFNEYSDPYLIEIKAAMQAIEESQL